MWESNIKVLGPSRFMCFDFDGLSQKGNYETWGVAKYMKAVTVTVARCHDKPICKSNSEIEYFLKDKVAMTTFFSKQPNLKSYENPVIVSKSDINPVSLRGDQYTYTA